MPQLGPMMWVYSSGCLVLFIFVMIIMFSQVKICWMGKKKSLDVVMNKWLW